MEYNFDLPDDLSEVENLPALEGGLSQAINELTAVRGKVRILMRAEQDVERVQRTYLEVTHGEQPALVPVRGDADLSQWPEWRQPLGAHDAYPLGWVVRLDGELWESVRGSNVWRPGTQDSGWENVTPGPGEPMPEAPEDVNYTGWEPWRDYRDGTDGAVGSEGELLGRDYVAYGDTVYACVQSHTSQPDWTPPNVPALWAVVGELPEEEGPEDPEVPEEPDEEGPEDPEVPEEPEEYPQWKQPTGAHDAYGVGDRVIYEGQVWESQHAGNVWPPPTQWTLVE